jgi:hypothetical protein
MGDEPKPTAFRGLYRDVGWAYVANGTMSLRVFKQDYCAFGYEPSYEKLPWKDEFVEWCRFARPE